MNRIKNIGILLVVSLLGFTLFACKTEDKTQTTESTTLTTVSTSESSKATTTIKTETTTEPTTTSTEKIENTTIVVATEASVIDSGDLDQKTVDKVVEFINPIYYNVIFGSKSYDDGITEKDMMLFAISYIYQYEYSELKFDTSNFILHVPAKRVDELVKEYFDVEVKEHNSFDDDGIAYKSGFYLMPAADNVWNEKMIVESIKKLDDKTYEVKVMFDSPDGALPKKVLTIEERDGRFILIDYKDYL